MNKTDICIIGAGPAGCCLALRLARLGHHVTLIERRPYPRRHLGESLSAGVKPLIKTLDAGDALDETLASTNLDVNVNWGHRIAIRSDGEDGGYVVDRGLFDHCLLQAAARSGVDVVQPGHVSSRRFNGAQWLLNVNTQQGPVIIESRFVALAGGRSAGSHVPTNPELPNTLALYAYWNGSDLPPNASIIASDAEWFWGVPLPDRSYNAQIFIDRERVRGMNRRSIQAFYQSYIQQLQVLPPSARMSTPIRGAAATPAIAPDLIDQNLIRVGDAACAIDPLSASGVQLAIQFAFSAAVVLHTLLVRAQSDDLAKQFYRDRIHRTSERQARWAGGYYAEAAARFSSSFWRDRARYVAPDETNMPIAPPAKSALIGVSSAARISPTPCVVGDIIESRPALYHPALSEPVVFVDGIEIAPLLEIIREPASAIVIAGKLATALPPAKAAAITSWLVRRGVLEELVA